MAHPYKRHSAFDAEEDECRYRRRKRPEALLHGVGVHAVRKVVDLLLHPFEGREEDGVDHA